MERSMNCRKKLDRMNNAINHKEGDQVPVSDFFWSSFIARWQEELGLPKDASPYQYYDLDWICTMPNMDPHIKPFEVIKETEEDVILKTGFEAVIRHKDGAEMPYFQHFETDTIEKALAFTFDDPWDERRFFSGGDNQIAGVGDRIHRNTPPWIDGVKALHPEMPVYGSVCESHEFGWRVIGSENMLMWLALYPEEMKIYLDRVTEFNIELCKAQIAAADGLLDGMVIWGDVAYVNGMLFSPKMWRKFFKPCVKGVIDYCHSQNLPVIYHGCGNATDIFPDMIEMGLDVYNPLESKSGMDVIDKRKKFGHDIAFCGNIDALHWGTADLEDLKTEVLTKMNAAKGGGYIMQSDHSVPSNVSAERYEYVLNLIRSFGKYPLELGAYDIPEIT